MTRHKKFWKGERIAYRILIVICALVLIAAIIAIYFYGDEEDLGAQNNQQDYLEITEEDPDKIENGIHIRTGLIEAEGLMETVQNCTSCHSAKILTQNRLRKEEWIATIRWMQETQNLWDLGENEAIIVNYLATNYPPQNTGRRVPLKEVDWYELK